MNGFVVAHCDIAGDAEASSSAHRARQFALAELKALAKRAPGAVVATEGVDFSELGLSLVC